jgi:hypothetical protein
VYVVPVVEIQHTVFLKTIIPSGEASKRTSVRTLTMEIDGDLPGKHWTSSALLE